MEIKGKKPKLTERMYKDFIDNRMNFAPSFFLIGSFLYHLSFPIMIFFWVASFSVWIFHSISSIWYLSPILWFFIFIFFTLNVLWLWFSREYVGV